jgi:hypothetical protein
MNLNEMINELKLTPVTTAKNFAEIVPTCGYTSDLLSCVMSGAAHQSVWVTLQAHVNIVAVATLLDLSAIIITEGAKPDENTIKKANEEGINIFLTEEPTFSIVGKLWASGLRCQ